MVTIKKYENGHVEYELKDTESKSFIKVIPELGGMVSEFNIGGQDIFYFDKNLLASEKENMKIGGNPFLFPITGELTNSCYRAGGHEYFIQKHGFARFMPWQLKEIKEGYEGQIIIELKYNDDSLKMYPYKFRVVLTYVLKDTSLGIYQEYINEGEEEMPFYSGFHPFFRIKDKKSLRFNINADKYVDCTDEFADYYKSGIKEYNGSIDFERPVDFVFPLNTKDGNSYSIDGQGKRLNVKMSGEYKFLVMWSLIGKDFICVEPWMSAPDALNTGKGLINLKPGDSKKTWIEISMEGS